MPTSKAYNRARVGYGVACLLWISGTYFPQPSEASYIAGSSTPSGPAGGALTGTYPNPTLANITFPGAVPVVLSSGIITQDLGFTFNATAAVTPSAGAKNLNIASSNNYAALRLTSNGILRGSFGSGNGTGLNISDDGGNPIWQNTYGTNTSNFSGITKSKAFHGDGAIPAVGTCGTIGTGSTNNAGTITTATGACTPVVTFTVTAATGWVCPPPSNQTTPANIFVQTASSPTTATFTGVSAANDVIRYVCIAY